MNHVPTIVHKQKSPYEVPLRENVISGEIKTLYMKGKDQVADALTKGMSKTKLQQAIRKWGCIDIHTPLEVEC